MSVPATFVPEITALSCSYCGYMAADTAGALRLEYPANVKLVRLPCTGKVDVQYVLDAFEGGADAVYVVACSLGNCHHVHGNERGLERPHPEPAQQACDQPGAQRPLLKGWLIQIEIYPINLYCGCWVYTTSSEILQD